jgi:hypothetical protein
MLSLRLDYCYLSKIYPEIPSHWVISSTVFSCAGVYMVLCCTTFFKYKMGRSISFGTSQLKMRALFPCNVGIQLPIDAAAYLRTESSAIPLHGPHNLQNKPP